MRIDKEEHLKQAWRVHSLLHDFRIEDVWQLPIEIESDQYIGELHAVFMQALDKTATTGVAGWLFQFRLFLGRVFGWDDEKKANEPLPEGSIRERYAVEEDLPPMDFESAGMGGFVPVYDRKEEVLSEIENETVWAAAHFSKVERGHGKYGVNMTVYVKPKGLFGEIYMQIIKPFRLYIVYPVLLKIVGRQWEKYQNQVVSVPA